MPDETKVIQHPEVLFESDLYSEPGSVSPNIKTEIGQDKTPKDRNRTDSAAISASGIVMEDAPEIEVKRQARRDRKPLWICKMMTAYPKMFFAMTLSGHIIMPIITLLLHGAGCDVLPIKFESVPLDIRDHPDYLRNLAWENRNKDGIVFNRGHNMDFNEGTEPERSQVGEFFEIYFDMGPRGNVFTKEHLKKIQEVENEFLNDTTFRAEYCLMGPDGKCSPSKSILRFFDGTFVGVDPIFNDPNFDNIINVLNKANETESTRRVLQYHLGKYAQIDKNTTFSSITRSFWCLGLPLKGYNNKTHQEEEQRQKMEQYLSEILGPKADEYFQKGAGEMEFFYNSISLMVNTINNYVFQDFALVIGSLVFIIIFMCIQTRSIWVTLWTIFSIGTAFFCTNLIYRYILDFRYFGSFHILAVFIILGIGADDVFVFFDNWKETRHHSYESLAHRLSDCYRKASLAMFFTSITTAVAFLVNATSPFLGIYTFGVFAGILVIVNYVSVIIFFPSVVVTYHLYFEQYKCCCCCSNLSVSDLEAHPTSHGPRRKHPIVRFFRGPYYNFVTHKIARWAILAFFGIFLAIFVYFATQLEVNEEQIKFLKEDTNFAKYLEKREHAFDSEGMGHGIDVSLVWGLRKQDMSACHHTDDECVGQTVWDDDFDINAPGSQEALLALCKTLMELSQKDQDELMIKRDLITGKPEVGCFIDDLNKDLEKLGPISVPITRMDVSQILGNDTENLPDDIHAYFEVALGLWSQAYPGNFRKYSSLLGETKYIDHIKTVNASMGFGEYPLVYGTRLQYAAIVVNTTQSVSMGYVSGIPVREAWNNFMETQLKQMPKSLQGGFVISSGAGLGTGAWHWFQVQETLTSSAIIGIVIGLALAFPILVIATHNIIVGLMATLVICFVVVTVVGFTPMAGWKLGLLESLNMVLLVGLAVDYVVHLAEGYSRSCHVDRLGRTRDALEEVGISVLSGAATTLGAAFFLLFAKILFFTEFGAFVFCSIGASILYALGLFITVIAMIGPEGDTGCVTKMIHWLKCFISSKKT